MTTIECAGCGVTPFDFPFEELGMDRDEAAGVFFVQGRQGKWWCQGCATMQGLG